MVKYHWYLIMNQGFPYLLGTGEIPSTSQKIGFSPPRPPLIWPKNADFLISCSFWPFSPNCPPPVKPTWETLLMDNFLVSITVLSAISGQVFLEYHMIQWIHPAKYRCFYKNIFCWITDLKYVIILEHVYVTVSF